MPWNRNFVDTFMVDDILAERRIYKRSVVNEEHVLGADFNWLLRSSISLLYWNIHATNMIGPRSCSAAYGLALH